MGQKTLFIALFALISITSLSSASDDYLDEAWRIVTTTYPRYNATYTMLHKLEELFPSLVKIYSIGKSVQGREMLVAQISKDVNKERKLLKPPMKLVGNMHGDETVG